MDKTKASLNILNMYELLTSGQRIRKNELAEKYGVDQRTIQRYIADLRAYFAEEHRYEFDTEIVYDRADNSYYLEYAGRDRFYVQDILTICKILLDSRSLMKEEMDLLIDKLLSLADEKDKRLIKQMILNEKFHYIPPRHGRKLMMPLVDISKVIAGGNIIEISYKRKDGISRTHAVKPLFITFSEYYFYLVAFMADDSKRLPTVFRIDRIDDIKYTEKHFSAFKNRVEEGEFKKRVQFMYSGELHRVKFLYKGENIDSILDRLPTAQILDKSDEGYTVRDKTINSIKDKLTQAKNNADISVIEMINNDRETINAFINRTNQSIYNNNRGKESTQACIERLNDYIKQMKEVV